MKPSHEIKVIAAKDITNLFGVILECVDNLIIIVSIFNMLGLYITKSCAKHILQKRIM